MKNGITTKYLKNFGSLLVAAVLTVLSTTSYAYTYYPVYWDSKVHSGDFCQASNAANAKYISHPLGNTLHNVGTQSKVYVSCPILRDDTTNTSGATVIVRVNTYMKCSLYSLDTNNYVVSSKTGYGSSSIALFVPVSVSAGAYTLSCDLPPYGLIKSYKLYESTSTSTR